LKWLKMTEFEKKKQAQKAANSLQKSGFATQIRQHKQRQFNRQPSNYTLMRSTTKKGRR
jgi:hypothetical protein